MKDTVLIVGETGDWSAEAVAAELTSRGVESFRFDTADFPMRSTMSVRFDGGRSARQWCGRLDSVDGTLDIEEVGAVYYRKPRDFEFSPVMSEPERRFSRAQARVGIGGVLSSIPARWVNHPAALADAEYKPHQLAAAARCGLTVPPSLITNDPSQVRTFAATASRLIVKPLAAPIVHEGGGFSSVYTRIVDKTELVDLRGVEATAHLFQEFVVKDYEIRLTAVGDQMFPVAIHAHSPAAMVDWRTDYESLAYEVVECPRQVACGITKFLDSQGLVYGAFDFVVRPDGEWVFLEFTDRPVLRTSRSWRPVSGVPADRLPARSGTSVLFRWLDGACGADGVGRGSEGSGDHPRQGLAVVDGAVARGCSARAGRSVPAAA